MCHSFSLYEGRETAEKSALRRWDVSDHVVVMSNCARRAEIAEITIPRADLPDGGGGMPSVVRQLIWPLPFPELSL